MPEELRAELPELLWLYQMGLVLFWVHDRSAHGVATAPRHRPDGADRGPGDRRSAMLPALRTLLEDVLGLLADLRTFAVASVST